MKRIPPALAAFGALAIVVSFPTSASCQGSTTASENAQSPQQTNSSRIEIGHLANLIKGQKNELYYKLVYRGQLLRQKGTPLTFANINAPVEAPDPVNPGGDVNAFSARLERGSLDTTAPLIDLLRIQPLQLKIRELRHVRGAAQFSGQADGSQLNFAVGVESPPYHPLSEALRLRVPHWIVVGLQGEAQNRRETSSTATSERKDIAMATYRAFVGISGGYVASERQRNLRENLAKSVLAQAATYSAAFTLKTKLDQHALAKSLTPPEVIMRTLLELRYEGLNNTQRADPALWRKDVEEASQSYTVVDDQPTYTAELESAGWYTLSGQNGPRSFNATIGLTGTFYLNPRNDKTSFLRVRYQNGFDRSAPDVRQNFVVATLGWTF